MIFGDKSEFAVECEFTNQKGMWVYGSFRIWVGGNSIGAYSEEVLNLKGTTGVLREPVSGGTIQIGRLSGIEFLNRVFETKYGKGGFNQEEHAKWGDYEWVAFSEGFDTVFSVAALIGNDVRIVWRLTDIGPIREKLVSYTIYSTVCAEFIDWLDQGFEKRRSDIH